MIRDNLELIPQFLPLQGFAFRWYQSGDEQTWRGIHLAADQLHTITPELFMAQFGSHLELLPQRQAYLLSPEGQIIGTGTAWFAEHEGKSVGKIHWVAIRPEYQVRGLGKALMTLLCNRLRELGHKSAVLSTSTARIPAIKLYMRFGFREWLRSEL